MNEQKYVCKNSDENNRLDYVLKTVFSMHSIRSVKRLCEQNTVLVNEKPAKASYKVKENDCCANYTSILNNQYIDHISDHH